MGITLPLALLAGIVSFASPCFLPIVPGFLGQLVGTDLDGRPPPRRVALGHSLVFVAGFSLVFMALWASLGLFGVWLEGHRTALRIVGGSVLVVLGLHVSGLVRIALLDRQLSLPLGPRAPRQPGERPGYLRSALLGLGFGAGWTPCIGPVLGGIIGLAAVSGSAGRGFALLLAYCVGLGLPFVLVAVGASAVTERLAWFQRHHVGVSLVSGGLLVITGFLIITDLFTRLSGLFPGIGG